MMVLSKKDFFSSLGYANALFSSFDFLVYKLLLSLSLRPSSFGDVGLSTTGEKLFLLKRLKVSEVRDSSVLRDFKCEYSFLRGVADERNRYVHDQWIVTDSRISRLRLSNHKGTLISRESKVSVADIRRFQKDLIKAQDVITSLLGRLGKS